MQSVLNEDTFFDTLNMVLGKANKLRNKAGQKNKYYIGGSISRYSKSLTMSFPVLVDNGLSIETAQMISKANEKNIASMLEMLFASMSINGKDGMNGKNVISKFHHNIDDMNVDDYLDYANDFMANYKEAAYLPKVSPAQIRDIVKEMCADLKTTKKVFPVNSFNEKSLNDYMCKEEYSGIRVFEHVLKEDIDPYDADKFRHQRWKDSTGASAGRDKLDPVDGEWNQWQMDYGQKQDQYNRDYDYRKAKDDRDYDYRKAKDDRDYALKYAEWQDKNIMNNHQIAKDFDASGRNIRSTSGSDLRDMNNLNRGRILDGDFKKANELQPTLMLVNFNILNNEGTQVIDRKSFVAGVKCRMISTSTSDIIERLLSSKSTQLSFKNLIRATTGEIKLGRDFILAIDQQKLDAMNDVKKGESAKLWSTLKKRSVKNNSRKIMRNGNDASSITTLVVSQDAVNFMISDDKFNIEETKNAKMIMDRYNLLCLVIADETNEVAKFLYDGNSEYESISYLVLGREAKDREMRKATELLMKGR